MTNNVAGRWCELRRHENRGLMLKVAPRLRELRAISFHKQVSAYGRGGGGTRVGIVTRTLTVHLRLLATYFLGHTYSYYSRAKQCLRYCWLRQAGTQLQNSCNQGEPFSRNGVNPARQKCLIRIQSRTNGWWRCCCWPWFCLWS